MAHIKTVEAVYESGIFRPLQTLQGIAENSKVRVMIEYEPVSSEPFKQFAGILSNEEAEALQATINAEFETVDLNGW